MTNVKTHPLHDSRIALADGLTGLIVIDMSAAIKHRDFDRPEMDVPQRMLQG